MNDTIRPTVFIVDDDGAARDAIAALVESKGHQTRLFPSAEDFFAIYQPDTPGCVVTDFRMVRTNGLDLLERLRELDPLIAVILCTAFADVPLAVRAMKLGAATVLRKPCGDREMWNAIEATLSADSDRRANMKGQVEASRRLSSLSSGERQIVTWIVQGWANKQIARELDVSLRTVEARRSRILIKLGVETIADLIRLVVSAQQA